MDFRETVDEVHTVAFSTDSGERVFVLTQDGWRCYQFPPTQAWTA